MLVDAAGVVHEGDVPLTRLHAVANAPIFSYDGAFFGSAIVGGPLLLPGDNSRQAAAVAIRILGGEKPGEIRTPPVQFASPILTGDKCSAGASARKTFRREVKSCFVCRPSALVGQNGLIA